jgi:tellurite methyltransferase
VSEDDRRRWDARWQERAAEPMPAPAGFLVEVLPRLPRHGRALDVGGGAGRNALALARHGLAVTIADVSPVGLARALDAATAEGLALATVCVDLEHEALPPGPWDVIIDLHYLERRLFPSFAAALAPGGALVFVQPTIANLERHPHPGRDYLLAPGEAARLVAPLAIELAREGWSTEGRHEAEVLAWRRA